jgi:hypothetical protein
MLSMSTYEAFKWMDPWVSGQWRISALGTALIVALTIAGTRPRLAEYRR